MGVPENGRTRWKRVAGARETLHVGVLLLRVRYRTMNRCQRIVLESVRENVSKTWDENVFPYLDEKK